MDQLWPLLYATCFLLLLWQAFRVMGLGYRAMARPGRASAGASPPQGAQRADDRTGRLTIHPELLDEQGRLTDEDLLTVRFESEEEETPP